MKVAVAQVNVLEAQSDQTLAEWWCELNRWNWPEQLPDPEPPNFIEGGVRGAIMGWIMAKVGDRLCMRVWNADMPDDVFESFRRGERTEGTPYGDHLNAKVAKRMAAFRERENATLAADVILDDVLEAEVIG